MNEWKKGREKRRDSYIWRHWTDPCSFTMCLTDVGGWPTNSRLSVHLYASDSPLHLVLHQSSDPAQTVLSIHSYHLRHLILLDYSFHVWKGFLDSMLWQSPIACYRSSLHTSGFEMLSHHLLVNAPLLLFLFCFVLSLSYSFLSPLSHCINGIFPIYPNTTLSLGARTISYSS